MNKTNNINASTELRVAYQIKRHLNASLGDIRTDQLERLRAGREQALTKQKKSAGVLAIAGGGNLNFFGLNLGWTAHLVPLVVVLVGLMSINYWHQSRYAEEVAEIDAQMLVDELPPSAYLDRGFDSWLKRANQ